MRLECASECQKAELPAIEEEEGGGGGGAGGSSKGKGSSRPRVPERGMRDEGLVQ